MELYCTRHNLEVPRRKTAEIEENFEKYCDICDVHLTSDSMARVHYAGKQHITKKLKQISNLATTSANEDKTGRFGIGSRFAGKDPENNEAIKEEKFIQEALRNASKDDQMDGSFGTSTTSTASNKSKPVPLMSLDLSQSDYSCNICNVGCLGSKQNYEAHLQGKNHKKKVAGGEQVAENFHCEICNVTCANQAIFESHIRGKNHAKKRDNSETRVEGNDFNTECPNFQPYCTVKPKY